jgi:high-affinity Fe2+/Pb2+ permease
MPRGLIEGAETVLFFTLFLVFPSQAALLFGVFGFLTFLGAALRVRRAVSELPKLSCVDSAV